MDFLEFWFNNYIYFLCGKLYIVYVIKVKGFCCILFKLAFFKCREYMFIFFVVFEIKWKI